MVYLSWSYRQYYMSIYIMNTTMGIAYVILVATKKNIIPYLTNVKSVSIIYMRLLGGADAL